ncbi:MAG: amino acid adenylation domain-containing protein, partial [Caldisericaceae bacterium]|nr:amino acid adenylation domain-containing protein [Caldisericaceae bacterium]
MSSVAQKKNIEAIYPLSPMQQGMLFHYIYNPESATYFEQFQAKFKGDLDVNSFQAAWQTIINRHAVLRTSFVWKKLDKMLQVVHKEVDFPFEILDWRNLDSEKQKKKFNQFMIEDRKKGFDLAKAPLLRLYLIRLEDNVYQFLWSFHHLLTDGWSIPIILKEFLMIYEMKSKGLPIQLPPTRPYRDYINWLQKQNIETAKTYWKTVLKDFAGPSQLNIGRPKGFERDVEDTYEKISITLSKSISDKLFQLAKHYNVTLNSFVQAAWAILLSRYNSSQDIVFGATVSGRPPELSGVEQMVGLFINTIPVRVFIDGQKPVIDLVHQIQRQAVESREFEYMPLVEIKNLVNIPRELPLFDTIVVFENYPTDVSLRAQKGCLELLESSSYERTNFPITFVAAASDTISLEIAFETRRFEPQLIEQLLKHATHILEQMAESPRLPLSKLRLVDEAEIQYLTTHWNKTETPFEEHLSIHEKFEQTADQFPSRAALVYNDITLSYRELNKEANQLAHFLIKQGVTTETLVGICIERSPEMITALLAVLKAGGAFVPLDPSYPAERLKFIMNDSQIKILITHSNVMEHIPDTKIELIALDEIKSRLKNLPETNPGQRVYPENLAYVIYTSGSTGQPKGVLLGHRGVLNLKDAVQKTIFVSDEVQRVFQFASISFDASIIEIFSALLNGHQLHLTDRETILSIDKFTEFIESHKISFLSLPPSMYAVLPAEKIKSPKICVSAGEACSWQIVEKWAHGRRFINGYGPTEATVGCTWQVIDATQRISATPPIGNAIQNTQIYIIDNNLNPVPIGVPGELCIGGIGLARGYWQRPDVTAEKFIPNPFPHSGDRIYRTGDLVRRLPDGNIEFLGRIDFQVKLRGFRIELGEIEAAIQQINDILTTAVILREDIPGNKYLAAYYTTQSGLALPVEQIISHLKQQLPDYMVPTAFVHLDQFPLTPNGKINRRALPKPDEQQIRTQVKTAPRTPVEELLAAIWADILKIDNIGANDNFFDLGGHSLSATQLVSRIRNAFDVEIPIKTIFEFPILEELALQIEALKLQDETIQAPPIEPVSRKQDLPLSFSQQRLWFLDKLASGSANYNIPTAIRLKGRLNIQVLERCIQTLIKRHETLRTTFNEKDGEPVQVILPSLDFKLPVEDFSSFPTEDALEKAHQLAAQDAANPFDLANGPLFRIHLIKLAKDDYVVLFNLHHTITDGWSMGILVREVAHLYQALSKNQPSPLPELKIQYADYAVWQRKWLKGTTLQKHLDFWKKFLGVHPPALELPTDFPRPAMQTFNGRTIKEVLPKDLSQQIIQFSRKEGVTLFMTLLAVFQTLLYRYSNQSDILVGSPIANRTRTEVENLIGFFVNTLVFKAHFEPDLNFRNLLKQIRENSLKIYAHQDVPFEQVVEALQPERDLSRSPLFQVAFILQNAPFERMELPDLTLEPFEADNPTSKYDLTLNAVETPEGIECYLEFNTDLFAEQTAHRMLGHFQNILCRALEDAKKPLTAIDFLTDEEKDLILRKWNRTARAFPDGTTVH